MEQTVSPHTPRQKGRIKISLHLDSTGATVDTLGENFLLILPTAVAELRKLCAACRKFDHSTASTLSLAAEDRDKHPRRPHTHQSAILFLQSSIAQLLSLDHLTQRQDTVGQFAMQRLPVSRLPTQQFRQLVLSPALAFGLHPLLWPCPHPAIRQVVVRVVRPALAVQLPLRTANRSVLAHHLLAEWGQKCCTFSNHRNGRWTNVQTHHPIANLVLWLVVRLPLADQLDVESIHSAYLSPYQPYILHPADQCMGDQSREIQPEPFDVIAPPADTRMVGLAFHRVQLTVSLEPGPATLPKQPFVDCGKSAGG